MYLSDQFFCLLYRLSRKRRIVYLCCHFLSTVADYITKQVYKRLRFFFCAVAILLIFINKYPGKKADRISIRIVRINNCRPHIVGQRYVGGCRSAYSEPIYPTAPSVCCTIPATPGFPFAAIPASHFRAFPLPITLSQSELTMDRYSEKL